MNLVLGRADHETPCCDNHDPVTQRRSHGRRPGGGAGGAPSPIYSPAPAAQWTGWYFGLDAGYGWAAYSGVFDSGDVKKSRAYYSDADPQGGVIGGHFGYDWQTGGAVWGVEADAAYAGISGSAQDHDGGTKDVVEPTLNFLGSLRGRAGGAVGNSLFYATGGLAVANSDVTNIDNKGSKSQNQGSLSFTSWGGVVGAGVEHKFTQNVSMRLEGFYYFFDSVQHNTSHLTKDSDKHDYVALNSAAVVQLGLNFRY